MADHHEISKQGEQDWAYDRSVPGLVNRMQIFLAPRASCFLSRFPSILQYILHPLSSVNNKWKSSSQIHLVGDGI